MGTIYKIIGGGQKVCQNAQRGISTEVIKCDLENTKCVGQCQSTVMWHEDLKVLQQWSNEWAGKEVQLRVKE